MYKYSLVEINFTIQEVLCLFYFTLLLCAGVFMFMDTRQRCKNLCKYILYVKPTLLSISCKQKNADNQKQFNM